jgi:hypothetical protein
LDFSLYPWRFTFVARDRLYFPAGKSANILRGALGTILDAGLFAPKETGRGPSGLSDMPRPFVFRASRLDGRKVTPGERFDFDLHVFETRDPRLECFVRAFEQVGREGFGPGRGHAELAGVEQLDKAKQVSASLYSGSGLPPPLRLPLDADAGTTQKVVVRFVTPTELKAGQQISATPEFDVLFARVRDRLSSLRSLYGSGPLEVDFKAMGERAAAVRMTRCEVRHVAMERRSSRTGQVHPLSGFVGEAEYEGDLAEFVPWLEAAEWTGVGRQTVWGKGEILVRGPHCLS